MIRAFPALLLALALGLMPAAAHAQQAPCQFVLGFATMAGAVPQVGQCKENQHDDGSGNQVQATTGGLLVWRKADNWTAFTDGYHSWVNGPNGVQERLNSQHFVWESGSGPIVGALVAMNGEGDTTDSKVFDAPASWALTFTVDCTSIGGRGNFVVTMYNSDGSYRALLVNGIYSTAAKKSLINRSSGPVYLEVNSACYWELQALPASLYDAL